MTPQEGNDEVRPDAGDVQPEAPAPEMDVDTKELMDALAAEKAEEAAAAAPPADPEQPGTTPQTEQDQPTDQPAEQPHKGPAAMIPKVRFDEAVSKAQQEAAYWRGKAEALTQVAPAQGQPTQQAPAQATHEQQLAEIHKAQDDLAAKFDAGEITRAEEARQLRALANQEQAIREAQLAARYQPAPQQSGGDLYLQERTAEIEQDHPWVNVLEKVGTQKDWDYLRDLAVDDCIARGIDPRAGDLGKLELRKAVATLADKYGPALWGDKAKAKGIPLPGTQPQQQPAPGGLSPTAKARAAKLELAGSAPVDIQSMTGQSGTSSGVPSASQIEAMSDDQIAALPKAVQDKILGITS